MRFNLDNYETVESRLAKFWEQYPNGRIATSVFHYDDNKVVFRAEVYVDAGDEYPKATGFAEELRDASPVNRTSHVENAETSAIGRALANFVFQSKTAPRPSREEMSKVARAEQPAAPTQDFVTKYREACAKKGINPDEVAKLAGVDLGNLVDADHAKLRDTFKTMSVTQPFQPAKAEDTIIDNVQQVFTNAQVVSDKPKIKDPNAPASTAQVAKVRAMLSGKGIQSYNDKLDKVRELLNRPDINKLEHLTKGEASNLIELIEVGR